MARNYRDGIDFLKFMSLFADKNNPKKELDWIFFDREAGAFVATNTRMLCVITPKSMPAAEIYDNVFPHFNTDGRDEYLDKRGIGFRYAQVDNGRNGPFSKLERTYPEWKRIIPDDEKNEKNTRVYSKSMWKTTIEQNIILDVFGRDIMRKALDAIGIYEEGYVVYGTDKTPILYEVERKVRYGTGYDDYFDALVQVVVMPLCGLGE